MGSFCFKRLIVRISLFSVLLVALLSEGGECSEKIALTKNQKKLQAKKRRAQAAQANAIALEEPHQVALAPPNPQAASSHSQSSHSRKRKGEQREIDVSKLPENERILFAILISENDKNLILETLKDPELVELPSSLQFRYFPIIYFEDREFELFDLFIRKFRFDLIPFRALTNVISSCYLDSKYFMAILESHKFLILENFDEFWEAMLVIERYEEFLKLGITEVRRKCTSVPPAVFWAFNFFKELEGEGGGFGSLTHAEAASYCIFSSVFVNVTSKIAAKDLSVFPESFIKDLLDIKGIDLNVDLYENACLALCCIGFTNLPDYYHQRILADKNFNVNTLVPAYTRKRGHLNCMVSNVPVFWYSVMFKNFRAMRILWQNKNLHILPLIPSFFKLLRLFFTVIFFVAWDAICGHNDQRIVS